MNIKRLKKFVTCVILLSIVITPIVSSIQASQANNILNINRSYIEKNNEKIPNTTNSDIMKIMAYIKDKNGGFTRIYKEIPKTYYNQFIQQLSDISDQDLTLLQYFQQKLQIMQDYDVIPDDITLDSLLDLTKTSGLDIFSFNVTEVDSFISHFAPIFIVGMGFGLGLGYRRMPVYPRIAGNLFSAGVIGLGLVVCLDIVNTAVYYQFTYTYPLLFHILSGFIGIMLFAFDSIFPLETGPPITIYSNFVALGIAGLAIGFKYPQFY
jgi:hypothetical protein